MVQKKLGTIFEGSLCEGLGMRLLPHCDLERIKTGKFVCIKGAEYSFFCLVTDIQLQVSNSDILLFPPSEQEVFLTELLKKRDMYVKVLLKPLLMLDAMKRGLPVKTIPAHFSPVFEATNQDVADIFGDEKKQHCYFSVGQPLDMDSAVCINMDKFIERSNGIFGKTGTGKTFITRVILAGLIKKEKAVCLIFDMHSEYGFQARKEGGDGIFVKGLKTLFGNKIAIFSLDPAATRRRGCSPDVEMLLYFSDIRIEDVLSLQSELGLHTTALEAAYLIANKYKQDWLSVLLDQEGLLKEFALEVGAHPESIAALYRKLKRFERFNFLIRKKNGKSPIDIMLDYLQKGIHVILEFGTNTSVLSYLLVANVIARRVHEAYVAQTEKFLASQMTSDQPHHLVITIEEAHKFLSPAVAHQTIFGIIAREMRKYFVSLFVVDQRPSGIDEEVLSQLGTKIIAQLNDEKDIQAVLNGMNNMYGLRTILSSLDSKKQVLLLGHAVAMPVVVRSREYDETFYKAMGHEPIIRKDIIDELFQ